MEEIFGDENFPIYDNVELVQKLHNVIDLLEYG